MRRWSRLRASDVNVFDPRVSAPIRAITRIGSSAPCAKRGTAAHVGYIESRSVALGRGVLESRAYLASQIVRKRIEQFFGWGKTVGGLRKTRLKGVRCNAQLFNLTGAAYNLLRISRLSAGTVEVSSEFGDERI